MSSQRQHAVAAVAVLLAVSGCLSALPVSQPPTPTPEAVGFEALSDEPSPQTVSLENRWNRTVTAQLRVVRVATNTTVHNETYHLPPRTERTVYNTSASDPEGVESFRVTLSTLGTTEHTTIENNACFGGASGTIRGDGTVSFFASVC
ncbi:hypothetical protein [Halosimplex sp. TS25]|uniref:hypothetical protein n=1 Tax=Halosimplex rarum TaxID=3396619 RepID=UPI0039EA1F6C